MVRVDTESHQNKVPEADLDEPKAEDRPEPPAGESERVLRAEELFGGRREVWIELDGVRYRLRVTRRGKLILQK